jgi:gluconokinase
VPDLLPCRGLDRHSPRPAVLALDIGTSSCRARLYEAADGRPVRGAAARIAYSPRTTPDGGAELDPDALFDSVCACIDQVLAAAPPADRSIAGVATSCFWHSLLGLNAEGQPVGPIYLWLDARAGPAANELRQRLDSRAVHARTGCVLHWSYWPAKLVWLSRAEPEQVRRVARWVSFGELLLERLTGQCGPSVSMASATGLLDQHTCHWDTDLLADLPVQPDQLEEPRPLSATSTLGEAYAARWPALRGVPWLRAVGDGACSNLGAGCATEGWFALMIGTSAAERAVWSPKGPFTIPWGAWCYRVDEQRVVLGGAMNDGGSLWEWLRQGLRLPPLQRLDAELAVLSPDEHGLTVLPFWGGERSVGWADDARGAVVGLRLHTRPVELARACLEAVALRFRVLDGDLRQAMPGARGDLVATGGALLHSPAWLQIVADALGRRVYVSREPEASSRGASLLGAETLGLLERPLDALTPAASQVYEPVAGHTERYRLAAVRQQHLYDLLVGESRWLNG